MHRTAAKSAIWMAIYSFYSKKEMATDSAIRGYTFLRFPLFAVKYSVHDPSFESVKNLGARSLTFHLPHRYVLFTLFFVQFLLESILFKCEVVVAPIPATDSQQSATILHGVKCRQYPKEMSNTVDSKARALHSLGESEVTEMDNKIHGNSIIYNYETVSNAIGIIIRICSDQNNSRTDSYKRSLELAAFYFISLNISICIVVYFFSTFIASMKK